MWSVQNSGSSRWPEQLRLLPVSGSSSPFVLESDVLLFTDLAPAEQLKLSVPITTPSQAGRYVATYRLAFYQPADSQWTPFGDPLLIDLHCKDNSNASTTADSAAALSPTPPAVAETAQTVGGSAGQQGNGVDGERKGSVGEEKPQRKASREQKEAAIAKRIVDTAVESTLHPPSHPSDPTPSPYTPDEPHDATDGQAKEGKRERRERLRVEKTKDRSASVDSKPPTLNSEWFSFVPTDATSRPSSIGPAAHPQQSPPAESQNLLSSSPRSSPAVEDEELDWLNDAKSDMKVAVVAPTPSSASQTAAGQSNGPSALRPSAAPLHMSVASKSASHSRSNSPALPPQIPPATAATFARSTSQQFPPQAGLQGGEILSPPLTPTVPTHSAPPVRGSMISKDDLMSWAGGTGLSVTNKQTGVQSQHAPSPSLPPQLTNGGGAATGAGEWERGATGHAAAALVDLAHWEIATLAAAGRGRWRRGWRRGWRGWRGRWERHGVDGLAVHRGHGGRPFQPLLVQLVAVAVGTAAEQQ